MKKAALLSLILLCATPLFAQVAFQPVIVQYPNIDVGGDPNSFNYVTVIQAVNNTSAPTNGHIVLYSSAGAAIAVSFDGAAPATSLDFTLDAGVTKHIVVSASGAITQGWMQINYIPDSAEATVLVQYFIGTSLQTEFGISPFNSSPFSSGLLSATDFAVETGSNLNAGVAIANPNSAAAAALVRLWNPSTGALQASTAVPLPANGYVARLLTDLFPTATSTIAQVSVDSCSTLAACTVTNIAAGPTGPGFIATALRLNLNNNSFTSIPVFQRASSGLNVQIVPQIAVGGDPGGVNYQTVLYLTTISTSASGSIDVLDNNGNFIPVTANGTTTTGHFSYAVLAEHVNKIVLSNDTFQLGWIRVTPSTGASLIVNSVYQTYNGPTLTSEAGVLTSPSYTQSLIYVSGTDSVGIALANNQSIQNTLNLTLFNRAGFIVATTPITLNPSTHLSEFVYQLFPQVGLDPNFNGSLWIQSTTSTPQVPVPFAAVAIHVTGGSNFAALQVASAPIFYPSITGLRVNNIQRSPVQITFSIDVSDDSAYNQPPQFLVSSTAPTVGAEAEIVYHSSSLPSPDDYPFLIDGTSMINTPSGTIGGTFASQTYSSVPSGTTATFYIYILDTLGNTSNVIAFNFKF